jgi:hypothetical protein
VLGIYGDVRFVPYSEMCTILIFFYDGRFAISLKNTYYFCFSAFAFIVYWYIEYDV